MCLLLIPTEYQVRSVYLVQQYHLFKFKKERNSIIPFRMRIARFYHIDISLLICSQYREYLYITEKNRKETFIIIEIYDRD